VAGGTAPPAVRRWLSARLPARAALGGADSHRTAIDTVDGAPWAFAFFVWRDEAHAPRALYGLALTDAGLARELEAVLGSTELLPPALAGRPPQLGHVAVRVRRPDGGTVLAGGTPHADVVTAADTLPPEQGALVVVASLDAGLAASRLLGGTGAGPAGALLALLALAAVLAAVALDQLRRGRELARLRTQFVASVSHELRTPLAHVSAFAETLMHGRERSAEERRYFAGVVYREARRLAVLVESVLRFSRRGAETWSVALTPCALGDELRESVAVFRPIADAAGARIEVDVPEHVRVLADAAALRQVVLNLLDNAVKYAPRGATVGVRGEALGGEARVVVVDEGAGVPAADRERVFEAFVRLAPPGAPGPQGTGIGLAVVRDLVEAMRGRVWIDDAPGGGARVIVALAVAPPATGAPAECAAASLAGRGP
jgi:signal transduction histidine kinase